jgi:WD40 repeat protein
MNIRFVSIAVATMVVSAIAGCGYWAQNPNPQFPADPRMEMIGQDTRWIYISAVSPDGSTVASVANAGEVRLWDVKSQRALQSIAVDVKEPNLLLFSPNGKQLLIGERPGKVMLLDTASGKPLWTAICGNNAIYSAAFSPDGKLVAVSGWQSPAPRKNKWAQFKIWDAASGNVVQELMSRDYASALAFASNDRLRVVSWASSQGYFQEVQVGQTPGKPVPLWRLPSGITAWENPISPTNKTIAAADVDGNIWLWDVDKKSPDVLRPPRKLHVRNLAFSPGGKYLAHTATPNGSSYDGRSTLQVWDLEKRMIVDIAHSQGYVRSLYFLGDEKAIGYSDGKRLRIWHR